MNVLPASLEITFENQSNADATDVVFAVEANGYSDRFNDVGSFAKGVQIHHSFPVNPFSVTANFGVQVVQVSFADGTVWQNPDAPKRNCYQAAGSRSRRRSRLTAPL